MAKKIPTADRRNQQIVPVAARPAVGFVDDTKAPAPPGYSFVRLECQRMFPKWELVDDIMEGQERIKERGAKYLPIPRNEGEAAANEARYKVYIQRAVFYNATRRTLDGMIGQVFARDPETVLPPGIVINTDDIDGAGVSLDQQAKTCLTNILAFGFGGIFVDFPDRQEPATKQQLEDGDVGPTIIYVKPQDIINWKTRRQGKLTVPYLVVIREDCQEAIDDFADSYTSQWRELRLDAAGNYLVQIWRRTDPEDADTGFVYKKFYPLNADGEMFTTIPFQPVGSVNNNWQPDEPPIYDLAVLNIAHYRNSADYEEACFMVGQPTPWFSGLTKEWVEDVFKGKVYLGSRAAIPLPAGALAGLLQVNPNSMPKEAMDQKEQQMVALGAKLVVDASVQQTLGEAQMEESAENSILSTATKNVSAAYTRALLWAAQFVVFKSNQAGLNSTTLYYDLNTDFPAAQLTPNERAELILEWQANAITETEMRSALRRAGVATLDKDQYAAEIKSNPSPASVLATKAAETAAVAASTKPALNNATGGGNQHGI